MPHFRALGAALTWFAKIRTKSSTDPAKAALCLRATRSQPFAKEKTMSKIIAALIAATFSMGAFAQAASAPAAPAAAASKPAKAEKKAKKTKTAKPAKKAASAA
jgi:hypothetical protein